MPEKSTWILELVYDNGQTLRFPWNPCHTEWLFGKEGDGERRITKLLEGRWASASISDSFYAFSSKGLRFLRIMEQKGNPLVDAVHYEDPLN